MRRMKHENSTNQRAKKLISRDINNAESITIEEIPMDIVLLQSCNTRFAAEAKSTVKKTKAFAGHYLA